MNGIALRNLLLLSSGIIVLVSLYLRATHAISIFEQMTSEDSIAKTVIETSTNFLLTLPNAAIGFWAAHNLRPVKFVSDATLKKALFVIAIAAGISAVVSLASLIAATMPHLPNMPPANLLTILNSGNWFLYGVIEILILLFAVRQLSNKINKRRVSAEPIREIK